MKTSWVLRLLALIGAAVMVVAACGDADPTATDNVQLTTSTTAATSLDEVEQDQATDAAPAVDEGEHEHEHDEAIDAIAWDGPGTPEVRAEVTGDPESGWDIAATITGFEFSSPSRVDHVPGEGHTHVFVDGQLLTMSYEPVVHIDYLQPGEHHAMVTLSRNDHIDYSIDDELIVAMAAFTVPGDVEAADADITVMYMSGEVSGVDGRPAVSIGDTVEMTVHSDVADTVHVHGYDLFLDLDAGEMDTIRFTADIPGVFEVEFEDSGVLLFEFQVS
jgi:hypothetical protein